ncbi:hypothetical protein SLEP1_g20982 [Rubroshorea leprosula]|uniref:Uncharacterized protein n=1 Tax=Rubroshorea leprosula TaxID=152421 RepID=A0AAV5JDM0_9ROSI|nr:hypothetical protein SLEP1_g20982 [Rubroshorea leprosula]
MEVQVGIFEFSTSSISIEDIPDVASSMLVFPTLQANMAYSFASSLDFSHILTIEQPFLSPNEVVASSSYGENTDQVLVDAPFQTSLILPTEAIGIGIDEELSILHLLKAYGEATENNQKELAEEILWRLKDKGCPTGKTLQRLAHYLTLDLNKQAEAEYLGQESRKNCKAVFKAFYQMFPYGTFAHSTPIQPY